MSYNIDTWKTKELKNLQIPLSAFFLYERKDWHPQINKTENGKTIVDFGNDEIIGIETNGIITVEKISISGEFSGTIYNEMLKPALEKSKGILTVITIWEGGDSIYRLEVKNGDVKDTEVDL